MPVTATLGLGTPEALIVGSRFVRHISRNVKADHVTAPVEHRDLG
jgi:hypothetical protein